jgi:drug/metabolite transporter (DMT)-like permease
MNDPGSTFVLSKLLVHLGPSVSLACFVGLIAGVVLVVFGVRARRAGRPTVRHHWWLIALMRVVLLVGASKFLFESVGAFNELIGRTIEMGFSKGADEFLLVQAYRNAGLLLPAVAVALFMALCILALGPPVHRDTPSEEA